METIFENCPFRIHVKNLWGKGNMLKWKMKYDKTIFKITFTKIASDALGIYSNETKLSSLPKTKAWNKQHYCCILEIISEC